MGLEAWREVLKEERIITEGPDARLVREVGARIAAATNAPYEWEFVLLDDPETVNAFCLPGGKIAVYSGILPVTQNPDGLAAVLGHEVAHATAHHGAERVSQGLVTQGILDAASASLSTANPMVRTVVMQGLGVGAEVGALLPYSRLHESEADEIGLRYMIRAGYNPHEAVRLWQRMAGLGGGRAPEFLSTHPDPEDRAARLARLIPAIQAEELGAGGPR